MQIDTVSFMHSYHLVDELTHDSHSDTVNIGFPFTFYGNTYHQCVISSNGYLTFELSAAGTYSFYGAVPLPDSAWFATDTGELGYYPGRPPNRIMFPWADFYPYGDDQGTVSTLICGESPDRSFICTFDSVPIFGPNTGLSDPLTRSTFQVVLHETTNTIEMNVLNLTLDPGINYGIGVQGLVNQQGKVAHVIEERNGQQGWVNSGIALDSYRFTPDSSSGYQIDSIGFSFVNPINNLLLNGVPIQSTSIELEPDTSQWYIAELESACSIRQLIGADVIRQVTSDSVFVTVNTCAATNELNKPLPKICPNPATTSITIQSQTPLAQVKLMDLAGRLAHQPTMNQAQSNVSIDVSSLPSGIYLLEAITQDSRRSVQKMVVQ